MANTHLLETRPAPPPMKTLTCPVCHRPAVELYHVQGHPGEYCLACRPTVRPTRSLFDESVNGVVIGTMTTRYEFWTRDNASRIMVIDAESDEQAIAAFIKQHPDHWAAGARMRIFE